MAASLLEIGRLRRRNAFKDPIHRKKSSRIRTRQNALFQQARWFDDVFFRQESPSSVRPSAELSLRNAKAVSESYRIDEFCEAVRRRQSRSPEQARYRFLIGGLLTSFTR
jgi:hypothetical protein